ncbi:MAG: hypothetical protein ABSC48_11640 [Terracidiphilus sp.]|jgi:hypothetical protein
MEYLHRYLWQSDFMWNHRKANDGERTVLAIKAAEGKRLMYRRSTANKGSGSNGNRESGKAYSGGEIGREARS